MPLLVPGIGKKQLHAVETVICDLLVQNFDGIMIDHAQVAQAGLMAAAEQSAHAGAMYFYTDEVALGVLHGLL